MVQSGGCGKVPGGGFGSSRQSLDRPVEWSCSRQGRQSLAKGIGRRSAGLFCNRPGVSERRELSLFGYDPSSVFVKQRVMERTRTSKRRNRYLSLWVQQRPHLLHGLHENRRKHRSGLMLRRWDMNWWGRNSTDLTNRFTCNFARVGNQVTELLGMSRQALHGVRWLAGWTSHTRTCPDMCGSLGIDGLGGGCSNLVGKGDEWAAR